MKFICNDKGITALYTEELRLNRLGVMQATRVSEVSHGRLGWYAAIPMPVGSKIPVGTGVHTRGGVPVAVLGPFDSYSSAVTGERTWIDQHILLDLARIDDEPSRPDEVLCSVLSGPK